MVQSWAISVVSHGHGATVAKVLGDLHRHLAATPHELILTLNAGEDDAFVSDLPTSLLARLHVIRNSVARGFGANHNAALRDRNADFFLIADPDLAVPDPIFVDLQAALTQPHSGIVAPLAVTPAGAPEDNGRSIVTPLSVIRRRLSGRHHDACTLGRGPVRVDWLAGLCLALRAETFKRLDGFDERYHMYCEDVDLCLRARHAGLTVTLLSDIVVVHDARRASSRTLRHLAWHVRSLARLWTSRVYAEARRNGPQPPRYSGET